MGTVKVVSYWQHTSKSSRTHHLHHQRWPLGARYLGERDEERADALLSAGEAQVAVGGVEAAGRVAARMRRPHRARRHLMELLGAGEPEQGQGVLPDGLLLQDPAGRTGTGKFKECLETRKKKKKKL